MRALVFQADPVRPWLAARSVRSLRAAGFTEISTDGVGSGESPCMILRAGLIFHDPAAFRPPPANGAGGLMAVGLSIRWNEESAWSRFQALHGGNYPLDGLPEPWCEWHSSTANAMARLQGQPFAKPPLAVHWARMDHAAEDLRLYVMEVVTSLQHGGAERIACDLAMNLPRHGVRSRLVTLGKPHRRRLDAPADVLDLSTRNCDDRMEFLGKQAITAGVDVIHVHLTDAPQTRALSACGIPLMAAVHNARAGWPRDWETLKNGEVELLLACSQAVEIELRDALPGLPVRTVWNGIEPGDFPERPHPVTNGEYVLVCVANPRAQKRMERLPEILAATREELAARGFSDPRVRLVLAGEVSEALPDAVAARDAVDLAAARHGVSDLIAWTHGNTPILEILANAHVLVSCSAYEGLSLAHLEALSCGLPVIACDTGGTRELAWRNPAVTLMPADADAGEFARAITDALITPPPSGHPVIWRDFSTRRMTERVAMLARQVACRPESPGNTLWFITNNLSTGGAQSSLRRLVKEFHSSGRKIRVALLQEYPDHPTHGRLELEKTGVRVLVPPPAGLIDPRESVDRILGWMAADPPSDVIYWNAITTHKLLLADALPFTRIHEVSPGEMWFASLDRYLENPLPGIPCRVATDYGRLLTDMVVKYSAEAPRAAALGVKVRVIPNGVAWPPARKSRAVGQPWVFGTAARISPQKRLDELIESFRLALPALGSAVLRIAGDVETGAEDCAAELRKLAHGLPIEWLGEIRGLAEFHQSCDAFVMISDPAGCPNASLEALAAGLPVIATDVGGSSEQVIDGVNGRLVPPRDIPALAAAMVDFVRHPDLHAAWSQAAREVVRRSFTLERMTADYLELLEGGTDAVNPQ